MLFRSYLNNILNYSSNTTRVYTQGIEYNIANISNNSLVVGQNWTLSCMANDGTSNSSWMNSSVTKILQGCQDVNLVNSQIILSTNISTSSNCINVVAQNVTLDCAGFSITGNNAANSYGVYTNSTNTNVKNCIIKGFKYGVWSNNTNYTTVLNNIINLTLSNAYPVYYYNSKYGLIQKR